MGQGYRTTIFGGCFETFIKQWFYFTLLQSAWNKLQIWEMGLAIAVTPIYLKVYDMDYPDP